MEGAYSLNVWLQALQKDSETLFAEQIHVTSDQP